MSGLGSALTANGHKTEAFSYIALFESFDDIAQRLRDRLQICSASGAYGIVSHSLGGVLARAALTQPDFPLPTQVVMLAPPNRSPRIGRLANRLLPYQLFSRQCGANLASHDFYTCLPPLNCPYKIIVGTAGPVGSFSPFRQEVNDGIVSIEEAKMREGDRLLKVPAFHSFIMNHPQTKQLTVQAFSC